MESRLIPQVEPTPHARLKFIITSLLKLALLLSLLACLLPAFTVQQWLQQTYPFAPEPFAYAGGCVMVIALLLGRLLHAKHLWLVTLLMLGFAWMLTQSRDGHGGSVLPFLLYPALLLACVNFLYHCRILDPFLILLPLLINASIFLQLLYSPLLLLWLYQFGEPHSLQYIWPWMWILLEQNLLPCLLASSLLLFYVAGKHLYAPWVSRRIGGLTRVQAERHTPVTE